MSSLANMISVATEFVTASKNENSIRALEALSEQQRNIEFNVCFAGGFSKGKTHLINEILDTDIFPETASPTTTLLTKIRYGQNSSFTFKNSKEGKNYELNAENLENFSVEGIYADNTGFLDVFYRSELLNPSIVIYDTPGVDDVIDARGNITFKALENCDAAIIAISALSPLGITEKSFIDTYLYERSIPKIALAITFIDKIPQEKLVEQINFINSKVKNLYPNIEVWHTQKIDIKNVEQCPVVGIEEIRQRIKEWSSMPDLKNLRERRDLLILKNILEKTINEQKILQKNIQDGLDTSNESLKLALKALNAENDIWKDLRSSFIDKSFITIEILQKSIVNLSKRLASDIHTEGADNFEESLRLKLRKSNCELRELMQKHISEDLENLAIEFKNKFNIDLWFPINSMEENNNDFEFSYDLQDGDINDIGQILLGFVQEFVFSKIPSIVPIQYREIVMPILEKLNNGLLSICQGLLGSGETQKKRQLDKIITNFCFYLEKEIQPIIRIFYEHIAENIQLQQKEWIENQQSLLEKLHKDENLEKLVLEISQNINMGTQIINNIKA